MAKPTEAAPAAAALAPVNSAPFVPVVPPATDYHQINTGISTELGDSAKTAFEKINAGFAHVYSVLSGGVAHVATVIENDTSGLIAPFEARIKALEASVANLGNIQTDIANTKALLETLTHQLLNPSAKT